MAYDKAGTLQRLKDAVRAIVAEEGVGALGVNAVAERAGVSKVLIYRYFGSFDGLLEQAAGQIDFWTNILPPAGSGASVSEQVKIIFRQQAAIMRDNLILRRFYHYESVAGNDLVRSLRTQRESGGRGMVEHYAKVLGMEPKELLPFATVLSNAITYVAMEMDSPPSEGLDFNTDEGWEAFLASIDEVIDLWLTKHGPQSGGSEASPTA